FDSPLHVHDRSMVQPIALASMLADVLASKATGGTAFSPILTLEGQGVVEEARERTRLGMAPFAAITAGPLAGLGWPGAVPLPLPLQAVRAQLMENVTDEMVRAQFADDMQKFEEEITKKAKDIRKPGVKDELEKYISEFVKTHELTRGASSRLDDQYDM